MDDLLFGLATAIPGALGGGLFVAWRMLRADRRPPTLAPSLRSSTAYRTLAASEGEKAADGALALAREAVAAERARVLAIVEAVDGASNYVEVGRACKAIADGVKAGPL